MFAASESIFKHFPRSLETSSSRPRVGSRANAVAATRKGCETLVAETFRVIHSPCASRIVRYSRRGSCICTYRLPFDLRSHYTTADGCLAREKRFVKSISRLDNVNAERVWNARIVLARKRSLSLPKKSSEILPPRVRFGFGRSIRPEIRCFLYFVSGRALNRALPLRRGGSRK